MKYILGVSLFLMTPILGIRGQSETKDTKGPKQVVSEFWKLETEGGRLTEGGWYKAGEFFVRPSPPPQKKIISVTSGKFKCSLDERWIKGNRAEISNECIDLGKIDNALRYLPSNENFYKVNILHHLVLTDKHWELGSGGINEREVSGSPTWRIENPEPVLWVTVDTAIRYVKEARAKTTDPIIKKNADQTLAKLKLLL